MIKSIKLVYKKLIRILLAILSLISILVLILNFTAPRIPILGFHSLIDLPAPINRDQNHHLQEIDYTKQDLAAFLDYLIQQNYWFVSTQELYDYFLTRAKEIPPEHLGQKPIMLSFDDGYKTMYTNLLPLLENLEDKYSRKVKVVLFVNPGTMSTPESKFPYHVSCNDLREGFTKGFYDIQSHGLTHKNLTEINAEDLLYEIAEAQVQLRKCTTDLDPGKVVASHIAYPYGATNEQVKAYVSKYYLSGYLYNSEIMKLGWVRNNYRIPRLSVNWKKSPARLIKMAERSSKLTKKE